MTHLISQNMQIYPGDPSPKFGIPQVIFFPVMEMSFTSRRTAFDCFDVVELWRVAGLIYISLFRPFLFGLVEKPQNSFKLQSGSFFLALFGAGFGTPLHCTIYLSDQ